MDSVRCSFAPLVVEQCWCLSLKELFQGRREPFQVGTKMLIPFITFLVKRQSHSKLSFYEDLLSNYVFLEQLVLTITSTFTSTSVEES